MTLRNQIVETIDPQYIKTLRNQKTDMITSTIPDFFEYLQKPIVDCPQRN